MIQSLEEPTVLDTTLMDSAELSEKLMTTQASAEPSSGQSHQTNRVNQPVDLKTQSDMKRVLLPIHQRNRAGFNDTFELSAHETIEAMNQSGQDIASQQPEFKLPLKKMGVTRTGVPVQIVNPFDSNDFVQISCDVSMHVSVAEDRRGIHVSRLGDTLASHTTDYYQSLDEYAMRVAESTRKVQHSDHAVVQVSGQFAFLEPLNGVKSKVSLESLLLSARAEASETGTKLTSGITFNHITACPCVQETFRHSHGPESDELMGEISRREMPLLTHSQRCRTTVLIDGASQLPNVATLLDCIDSVVVRCQNTMPREYELLTVYKAHHKPQFLEDVLRELSVSIAGLLHGNSPETRVRATSISMESIHDFDLDGEIDSSLADLEAMLKDE